MPSNALAFLLLLVHGSWFCCAFVTTLPFTTREKDVSRIIVFASTNSDGVLDEESSSFPSFLEDGNKLPILRTLHPELPGYQRMLELEESSNPSSHALFCQILQSPQALWRYGHFVHNETIGTLMQISDVADNKFENGRLRVVVQAVARLALTTEEVQWHNDKELGLSSSSKEEATNEFERWIDWEVRPTKFDPKCTDSFSVSPLINYNYECFPEEMGSSSSHDDRQFTYNDERIAKLESEVWIALDTMLALLDKLSNQPIPVPSQLLVLLPTTTNWPSQFRLATAANQLQARNVEIGTHTTSPFVRVGEAKSYPYLRRASRFSFAIWIVLDSILGNTVHKQKLLDTKLLEDRLDMALEQIKSINKILR
jgi:hypothetical protein